MPSLLHGQAEAGRLGWSHRPLRAPLRPAQEPLTARPDDDRRAALVAARTVALARNQFDLAAEAADVAAFGGTGAAVVVDGRALVDVGNAPGGGLGAALVWARRQGADRLDLVIEADSARLPGVLARQAQEFDLPIGVWVLDGSTIVEAVSTPHLPPVVPPPSTAEQVLLLEQAGLEVVVEQGEVRGEILGLEVARVVVAGDGTASLQVGIGRFDREAFGLLHGDLSPPEALAKVVAQVTALRSADAEPHPINRLARERWLRRHLIADPGLVGLVDLHAVEPASARGGLREHGVASARGQRADATPVMVAASVGVDLDAVPDAADTRAWHAPDAHLVIAVPVGDAHGVTRDLAERLVAPAEVVEVAIEWPR